ncbi:hypothetical protein C6495_06960 [Candidatus Poribacteria bacterium]|nr:MAG: hypothetical protein C6495_06960 [Candidatus Poribacteria bacterium]
MKMELPLFVQFSRFDAEIGANKLAYNLLFYFHQQFIFFVGFFVESSRRDAKARLPDTFRETNLPWR